MSQTVATPEKFGRPFLKNLLSVAVYLVPVIISVALFLILAARFDLYPIGKKSISWCDMNQQAIPILAEYRDVLLGKADLFVSYSNAGGMNFFVLFLYYCSSPFNLLLVFVKRQDISLFMNVLVMLKMAASSLTAFVYLNKKCGYKPAIATFALSIAYGFSGYILMYYQLISFLDCVYIFPLFLLGLEKIDEGKKPFLYSVTLSLSMLFCYYVAYMMILYAVIRFGVGYLCGYKDKKRAINFVFGSIIAALISAIVYLPVFIQFINSARTESILDSLVGSQVKTAFHTAALAVFSITVFLPMLFFKAESPTEKINRIMFVLLSVPLFLEPVNKMWHTGTYMSFPSRYAFLTVFSAIACVGEHLGKSRDGSEVSVGAAPSYRFTAVKIASAAAVALLVGGVAFFTISFTTENYSALSRYSSTLWSNDASLDLYLKLYGVVLVVSLIITLLYNRKLLGKIVFGIAVLALVISDAVFTFNVQAVNPSHEATKFKSIMDLGSVIEDDGFFRVKEYSKLFSGSDGIGVNAVGAMGYNSLAHYTSMTEKDYMSAIKKLGYSSYWMEVADYGGSGFSDAFLVNKYTIRSGSSPAADFFTDSYSAYLNPVLPLGIATSAPLPSKLSGERSDALESLYLAVTGKSGLVTKYPLSFAEFSGVTVTEQNGVYDLKKDGSSNGKIVYTINVGERQKLYFDCFDLDTVALKQHINDSFSVRVNNSTISSSYPSQNSNGLLYLGSFYNRTVTVEITVLKDVYASSFGIFGEKVSAIDDAIANANGADLIVKGHDLLGSVTAKSGDKLLIALPFDKGYTFRVNGKRVEAEKVLTDFIAIPLNEGENRITATYLPRGFIAGIIVTVFGVAYAVLFGIFGTKKLLPTEKAENVAGSVCTIGALVLSAAVLFAVYIAPLILCIF